MKPLSIRLTLLIQILATLALSYVVFSYVLFASFSQILRSDMDSLLLSKAHAITTSIETYWDLQKQDNNAEITFMELAQEWIEKAHSDSVALGTNINLFDHEGHLVAFSRSDPGNLKPDVLQAYRAKTFGIPLYKNEGQVLADGRQIQFRAVYVPSFSQKGSLEYLVQVGIPITSITQPLETLQLILSLILPFFLLVLGVVEFWFIRKIFEPLNNFIGQLHLITGENLQNRVNVKGGLEIQKLSSNFNLLLDRLHQAFESQRRVFEDLSHQLKTPLAVMKGELEVSLKKVRSPESYREVLESNLEEIDRLTGVVEELLKLARFDSKEFQLDRRPFAICPLLKELAEFVGPLAETRSLSLQVEGEVGVQINGDPRLLSQAILNLLDNAVKYAAPHTEITLGISVLDLRVRIWVRDFGMIIPENELRHLFERFYRGASGLKSKGYGLGLSIVKSIATLHEAQVFVTSDAINGTVFSMEGFEAAADFSLVEAP